MTEDTDPAGRGGVIKRLAVSLSTLLYTPLGQRARRRTTMAAALLFLALALFSMGSIGSTQFRWKWLLLAAGLTPLIQVSNALEYRLLGRFVGQKVGIWECLEITILASVANLLPIPGGTVVRIREMSSRSGTLSNTLHATVVVGLAWLSMGLAVAAIGSAMLHLRVAYWGFGLASLTTLVLMLHLAVSRPLIQIGHVFQLLLVEGAVSIIAGARIALVITGLQLSTSWPAGMIFAVSGPIAAMIGFFPGGLGLQELIAAALSPLVAISPAVGTASVAVDRILGYVALGLGAAFIWWGGRRRDWPGSH